MPTTGKKSIKVEFNPGREEEELKEFKIKCLKSGISLKEAVVTLIMNFNKENTHIK